VTHSTIARMRFRIIVASGHLSPRLAELAEFLLTATVLVGTGRKPVNSEHSKYMRKLLKNDGLNSPRCLNSLMRAAVLAPLLLGGATPDASGANVRCPPQAWFAHRAGPAYLLGFVDLGQGGTRGADGKEQLGIHVATGGIVTPVRALDVPSRSEKALARVSH
jgi:hypothetical protein